MGEFKMKKLVVSVAAAALTLNVATFANAQEVKQDTKKETVKKETTKKVKTVKTKTGKAIDKKLVNIDKDVQKIEKSIDAYFKVNQEGEATKKVSKTVANKKYKSFKGQLKAEANELNTVKKQLTLLNKKKKINEADYTLLVAKHAALNTKVQADIANLKELVAQATAKPATK